MERKNEQAILGFAVSAGEVLLQNGAEIFRVQETIARILNAFHLYHHSLYILSNAIFVCLNEGETNSRFALRFVSSSKIHLERLAGVNELSRQVEQNPDPAMLMEYMARLQSCAELPFAPRWLQILCCGFVSGCFSFLFGGTLYDSIAACICGFALQILVVFYGNKQISRYMPTILGSILVSFMAGGIVQLFPQLSLGLITIGAIISLVPGVAFTTSIREFFNGDYLAGSIHLIDAILTGICIAAGVALGIWFWQAVGEVLVL